MTLEYAIGDVVRLGKSYYDGSMAIIIKVNSASSPDYPGEGWITFDYVIFTETGELLHVSDVCIDKLICRLGE